MAAEHKNVPAKNEERVVTYTAADGQEIRLTPDIVKRFLVQGKGDLVTLQELSYFLNICKARRLNPLVKDCYLVKYSQNEAAAIITSVDFFRKRARSQKDCKGWKKGVLVQGEDGSIRDSYGLVMEKEKLVGGWFEAMPDGWLHPFRLEVNLAGYLKRTSEGKITKFWAPENQPTMIAKVAEAQGLRTVWPDEFQGLYSEDEMPPVDLGNGTSVIDLEAAVASDPAPELTAADFDKQLPEGINQKEMDAYVTACAKHYKITAEKVKIEAAANITEFLNNFNKWTAARAKKAEAEKQTAGETAQEAKPETWKCPFINGDVEPVKATCDQECDGQARADCPMYPKV